MVCPTVLYVVGLPLFLSTSDLVWTAFTGTLTGGETTPLPDAVASLVMAPVSRSAWLAE